MRAARTRSSKLADIPSSIPLSIYTSDFEISLSPIDSPIVPPASTGHSECADGVRFYGVRFLSATDEDQRRDATRVVLRCKSCLAASVGVD